MQRACKRIDRKEREREREREKGRDGVVGRDGHWGRDVDDRKTKIRNSNLSWEQLISRFKLLFPRPALPRAPVQFGLSDTKELA